MKISEVFEGENSSLRKAFDVATTPETMRGRFYEDFAMYPCAEQQHILAFIESELALRDAHHKALRAKELGELRAKMEAKYAKGTHPVMDMALAIVDDLIEKP